MYCGKCEAYIPEFSGIQNCLVCHASIDEARSNPSSKVEKSKAAPEVIAAQPVSKPSLKLQTWLLYLSSALQLVAFIPSNPYYNFRDSMLWSAFFGCVIVYFFGKGKNWARRLLLIACVFNIFSTPIYYLYVKPTLTMDVIGFLDMGLSLYLWTFLRRKDVRNYFKAPKNTVAVDPRAKKRKFWIGVGVAALIVALFVGVCAGTAAYFMGKAKQMDVWVQDTLSFESVKLSDSGTNTFPSFSHDGKMVVYCHSDNLSDKHPESSIVVVHLDDNSHERVIDEGTFILSPTWGEKDESLYYLSKRGEKTDIYKYTFAPSSIQRITEDGRAKTDLSASPDGKWLLYIDHTDDDAKLCLQPTDGGEKRFISKLNSFLFEPKYPFWQPDSKYIVFTGLTSLFFVDLEGTITGQWELTEYQIVNVAGLAGFPTGDNSVMIKARTVKDTAPLDFNLYLVFGKTGQFKLIRKSSVLEMGHQFSPDGKRMVFSKPRV